MNDTGAHKKICSICKREYTGYGNNAQPINNGRCCNACNSLVVVPMRLGKIIAGRAGHAQGKAG